MTQDEVLAWEFLDLLTTLELCVTVHGLDGKTPGQVNKEVVRCAKALANRMTNPHNKKVLKSVIRAPFPTGRVAQLHRILDSKL